MLAFKYYLNIHFFSDILLPFLGCVCVLAHVCTGVHLWVYVCGRMCVRVYAGMCMRLCVIIGALVCGCISAVLLYRLTHTGCSQRYEFMMWMIIIISDISITSTSHSSSSGSSNNSSSRSSSSNSSNSSNSSTSILVT